MNKQPDDQRRSQLRKRGLIVGLLCGAGLIPVFISTSLAPVAMASPFIGMLFGFAVGNAMASKPR